MAKRTLAELLHAAEAAGLRDRIELRDEVAAHGAEAIDAIAPWLKDPRLGAFAVRVIQRAGAQGVKADAMSALADGRSTAGSAALRGDIDNALASLGGRAPSPTPRTDAGAAPSLSSTGGLEWPGFQMHEFGCIARTTWRGQGGKTSLAPIITAILRYQHPHFESYGVGRRPELHFALRERYRQVGDDTQRWRAGKLVVYARGPLEDDPADSPRQVIAGLYFEKGDGRDEYGPVDHRWDWPWFVDALRTGHVRDDLSQAMVRHSLAIGDYPGQRFDEEVASVGFVARIEEGTLVLRDSDGSEIGRGWDALVTRLEDLPADAWHDLHVWRSWPAEQAIEGGRAFAFDELLPVLESLARVYLDVLGPALS